MAIVDKSTDHFNTLLYSGNGSSGHAITGVGFAPNMVWMKRRDSTPNHYLWDTIRGPEKAVQPNENYAQGIYNTNGLTAFGSDGFTVGSDGDVNAGNMVSWNWKAATSFSNNAGANGATIASTGRINTDAGFSIISWTGNGSNAAKIAHGLGSTPGMVITKRLNSTGDWQIGGASVNTARGGENSLLLLNTTAAMDSNSEVYQTFDSNTFQVGVNASINANGGTLISYCFAEKNGFSKFGTYTGNGSTNGPFSYTGFKPAFIIYKGSSGSGAADNWEQHDNKRDPLNPMESVIYPNLSNAESDPASTTDRLDMLSNGFKMRTSSGDYNNSGSKYFYIAFAENPFVTSTGNGSIPGTAK